MDSLSLTNKQTKPNNKKCSYREQSWRPEKGQRAGDGWKLVCGGERVAGYTDVGM